jgi:hypothetical protein
MIAMSAKSLRYLRLFKLLVLFSSTVLFGVWLGPVTFGESVLVDYRSGAVKHKFYVGPFLVREELEPSTAFTRIPVTNEVILRASPDWHIALRFRGRDRYSPNMQGGQVLYALRRLQSMAEEFDAEFAVEFKERFLLLLASPRPIEAVNYCDDVARRLLDGDLNRSNQVLEVLAQSN